MPAEVRADQEDQVIGRLIIRHLTVRGARLGVVEIEELRVGRLHVRELVVDDRR